MHNYIALGGAVLICLIIAGVKSIQLQPSELETEKITEYRLEALLKLQQVLQSNLLILNILLLLLLATTSYDLFQVIAFAFIGLVVVHLLAANPALKKRAKRMARRHMGMLLQIAEALRPALNLLDNTRFIITRRPQTFSSKAELQAAIARSKDILSKSERRQIFDVLEDGAQPAAPAGHPPHDEHAPHDHDVRGQRPQ